MKNKYFENKAKEAEDIKRVGPTWAKFKKEKREKSLHSDKADKISRIRWNR